MQTPAQRPGFCFALRRMDICLGQSGEGHRLCHAVQVPLKPPGLHGPASARPAHGGRFSPAGSGAGLSGVLLNRLRGETAHSGGETQCVSCSRPGLTKGKRVRVYRL